jgi:hypothetical protein
MTKPPLTVHNAEIRTATVEIKTLTVSGKQVTLAVFRQLPRRPLIEKDGTLNGVPWGTVNYHPDKDCPRLDPHIHVVWQRGTELCRAEASPPAVRMKDAVWVDGGGSWVESAVLNGWRPAGDEGSLRRYGLRVQFDEATLEIDSSDINQAVYDVLWPRVTTWGFPANAPSQEEKDRRAEQARDESLRVLRTRVDECQAVDGLDHAGLTAAMNARIADVLAARQLEHDRWRSLRDLPQLFIAV